MVVQAVSVLDPHRPTSRRKCYSALVVLVCLVSGCFRFWSRVRTENSSTETKLGPDRLDAYLFREHSVQLTGLDHPHGIHRKLQHVDLQSYLEQEQGPSQQDSNQQPKLMATRPSLPGQVQSIQQEQPSSLEEGQVQISEQRLPKQQSLRVGGNLPQAMGQQEQLRGKGTEQQEVIQQLSFPQGSNQNPTISHGQSQDSPQSFLQQNEQLRTLLERKSERPIMYTYYQQAVTDMTEDADADLIENWKKAWYDAGWQPVVLNEANARQLPEFDALIQMVVDPNHIGTYNMACYIRWMAMAAVGGGFMADYDTFPLNHFLRHGRDLPFDGELTVWSGHVPALVSGSGMEYLRVAKRIGLSIQQHVNEQKHINLYGPKEAFRNHLPWSDMLALSEIYKISQDMFIKKYEVVNGAAVLQVLLWTTAHCSMTNGMRAIHFSHKAMDLGKQAYRGAVHRATVARQFLNTWHKICPYTPVADHVRTRTV